MFLETENILRALTIWQFTRSMILHTKHWNIAPEFSLCVLNLHFTKHATNTIPPKQAEAHMEGRNRSTGCTRSKWFFFFSPTIMSQMVALHQNSLVDTQFHVWTAYICMWPASVKSHYFTCLGINMAILSSTKRYAWSIRNIPLAQLGWDMSKSWVPQLVSRGLSLKPVLNELEQFNGAFDRRMAHPWTHNSSGDHKPLIMQLMIVLAPKFWGLYKISTVLLTQSLTRKDKACKLFSARMTNANSCIWSHKLIHLPDI